jgi:hypothetical protein
LKVNLQHSDGGPPINWRKQKGKRKKNSISQHVLVNFPQYKKTGNNIFVLSNRINNKKDYTVLALTSDLCVPASILTRSSLPCLAAQCNPVCSRKEKKRKHELSIVL